MRHNSYFSSLQGWLMWNGLFADLSHASAAGFTLYPRGSPTLIHQRDIRNLAKGIKISLNNIESCVNEVLPDYHATYQNLERPNDETLTSVEIILKDEDKSILSECPYWICFDSNSVDASHAWKEMSIYIESIPLVDKLPKGKYEKYFDALEKMGETRIYEKFHRYFAALETLSRTKGVKLTSVGTITSELKYLQTRSSTIQAKSGSTCDQLSALGSRLDVIDTESLSIHESIISLQNMIVNLSQGQRDSLNWLKNSFTRWNSNWIVSIKVDSERVRTVVKYYAKALKIEHSQHLLLVSFWMLDVAIEKLEGLLVEKQFKQDKDLNAFLKNLSTFFEALSKPETKIYVLI